MQKRVCIQMCDMTDSYKCEGSSYAEESSYLHVWHDRFTSVPQLIHMCAMTHLYVCRDSGAWQSHEGGAYVEESSHSHVRHDSFVCVPWLIHMCAMPDLYVCHDVLIFDDLTQKIAHHRKAVHMYTYEFLCMFYDKTHVFDDKTHICFMTRLMYVLWQDSCMFYDKTHVCFMTRLMYVLWQDSYVLWQDSCMFYDKTHEFSCMFYDKTHDSYVLWQDSCMFYDKTHMSSYVCFMTRLSLWHDSFICVPRLIHMCDMTQELGNHMEAVRMYKRVLKIDEDDATGERVTAHIWLNHVTNTNESRHTCGSCAYVYEDCQHRWGWRHRCASHVTHMDSSRHKYEWITSRICNHVTHVFKIDEDNATGERVTARIWINHVTNTNRSRHTCEFKIDEDDATGKRVTSLIWINCVTNTNESRHTYTSITSHIWIQNRRGWRHRYASHVTHMN